MSSITIAKSRRCTMLLASVAAIGFGVGTAGCGGGDSSSSAGSGNDAPPGTAALRPADTTGQDSTVGNGSVPPGFGDTLPGSRLP